MKINSWIFDLGNTLMSIPIDFDEELNLQKLLNYKDIELVRSIIYNLCFLYKGQKIKDFINRFNAIVNKKNNPNLFKKIEDIWYKSVDSAQIKPGALDILDEIKSNGFQIALVSNTPPTSQIILDKLDLRKRFDVIVFSCDVGFLKPDPRIFSYALKKMHSIPKETIIVGDKIRTDILGGAILGMKSILIEENLRCIIENNQNYVNVISPNLIELKKTNFYKEIVYG